MSDTVTIYFEEDGSEAVWFLTSEQIDAICEHLTTTYGEADSVGP